MDAFGVLNEVLRDYENFVKGFLEFKDDQIRSKVEKELAEGLQWPKPWLALNPTFASGGTVIEKLATSLSNGEATKIFRATHIDPAGNR